MFSCFLEFLVIIFPWIPGIMNFTWWGARYFYLPIHTSKLRSGMWLLFGNSLILLSLALKPCSGWAGWGQAVSLGPNPPGSPPNALWSVCFSTVAADDRNCSQPCVGSGSCSFYSFWVVCGPSSFLTHKCRSIPGRRLRGVLWDVPNVLSLWLSRLMFCPVDSWTFLGFQLYLPNLRRPSGFTSISLHHFWETPGYLWDSYRVWLNSGAPGLYAGQL